MKYILFCLVFILLITSAASAQSALTSMPTGEFYINNTFKFTITIPNSWKTAEYKGKSDFIMKMTSPNQAIITIITMPLDVEAIDDEILYFQKALSNDKNVLSFLLEEDSICSVDKLEGKYRLYSFN